MNARLVKPDYFPSFKYYATVALYSGAGKDNRGRQNRRKKESFTPNVGFRHQLRAMRENENPATDIKLEDLDFDDHDHDETLLHAGRTYDKYLKEEEWRRKSTIFNIMRRKYFKEPTEPCFLTAAAKEQLRFLRETDPEVWTDEKLAESFPITITGVKKFLRNKGFIPRSDEDILAHDRKVLQNWKTLKAGTGGPIASAMHQKLLSGELNFESMNGHHKLPMPTEEWRQKYLPSPTSISPTSSSSTGEFESIIKGYKDLKEAKTVMKKDRQKLQAQRRQPSVEEQQQEDSYQLANLSMNLSGKKGNMDSTFEQFKASLKKQLEKSPDSENLSRFQDWMKKLEPNNKQTLKPAAVQHRSDDSDISDFFGGKIKMYKDSSAPDVHWDSPRGARSVNEREGYIYDSDKGYQRPYGRYDNIDHIEIPPEKQKEGEVYQKGDCFYDENGELLYRVPHYKPNDH